MKKLILILLIITSCSKEDVCDCYKITYETEIVVVIVNGEREERWQKNIIDREEIDCKDEIKAQYIGNDKYIDIECY